MKNEYKNITLPSGSWCGDREINIYFPKNWEINVFGPKSFKKLTDEDIITRLNNPIKCPSLFEILSNQKKIAIIVDDITRPTPVSKILSILLTIIKNQGINNSNIKIIIATGTHKIAKNSTFFNKLDKKILNEIKVIIHHCKKDLKFIGYSKNKIPIYINKYAAEADVKISIGGVYPHDDVGFSGGAKILIGVLGLKSISLLHRNFPEVERGRMVELPFRHELESIASKVGLDFSINVVIGAKKEIIELFTGHYYYAFRKAAQFVKNNFGTEIVPKADIVISNAYPLDTSGIVIGKSLWPFRYYKNSNVKIIIAALCEGFGTRYFACISTKEKFLYYLKKITMASYLRNKWKEYKTLQKIISNPDFKWKLNYVIFVPFIQNKVKLKKVWNNKFIFYSWDNLLKELKSKFSQKQVVKVVVYPCSPLQFPLFSNF
ncbi:hypothetical protein HS1_000396 [Candidatus Desulfofervidus auxilii]|uniref:LarA-like N-terminal domain-containing protein n=1 Tax=Desulfofervidus auxilii TaxID=1621989 RepID=A0A7U4QIW8_DESA2|nr:lactate racemase domain-containing protein [Candidatus Desulfofervidus auxilii]AMM40202.1 hypothetical protein HS1_000396 [Candidatus Desulfofervidus auxilii]CAD7770857.1 hypothetical protein BLFGPEAP_00457 [Candidatus Methanoperedenaceae archaeon GB50]CAD7771975.1 hypothetical protein DMNBHIDG_00497 [Candidatus Methanoperedenaceae archaeon GB37]